MRSFDPIRGCVAARCGSSPISTIRPLPTTKSPAAQLLEHPTRSRKVVGSHPIWGSDFFRLYVNPRIYIISLSELFRYFDWLTRRQLSITNRTSAKLSVSSSLSGLGEKNDALKVRFLVTFWIRILRLVKVYSPEESGRILAHENLHMFRENHETACRMQQDCPN